MDPRIIAALAETKACDVVAGVDRTRRIHLARSTRRPVPKAH